MEKATVYETGTVLPKERFAYWRDAVCESYVQLGCDTEHRYDFSGSIVVERHSILSISKVAGRSHCVTRRKQDIGLATDPYFLMSLQTANTSRITQFGRTAELSAGDMALYSSTDPYSLDLAEDFSKMVVQLPADRLLARLPNAQMMTAQCINGQGGIGKLVRENIIAFSNHADNSDPTVQVLVQDMLIDLIATGLASGQSVHAEMSSPEQHVMLRAKSFIHENLSNPDLDRQMVAKELGMSVRRLNAIFAKEDKSLSNFIRQKRLDGVGGDLRDPRFIGQSISEIAFSNMQNFSTLFRNSFGSSPRDYRNEMKRTPIDADNN